MKKILLAVTLSFGLILPQATHANIAVTWLATSTDPGYTQPAPVNGNNSFLKILSVSTSTFQNGINLTTGCFSVGGVCIGSGGGAVSSVFGRTGAVVAQTGDYTTAMVTEVTNLYFTAARVLATTLTGFVSGAGTISSSDTVLSAIDKLDGNIATKISNITGLITNGTGIGLSGLGTSGSPYSISNTGVTSIVAGTNISISGATGAVTINSTGSGGSGLSTTTPWTVGNLAYVVNNGIVSSVATSTLSASSPLTGSFTQVGTGGALGIQAASASQNGYLSLTDYQLLHAATTTAGTGLTYSGNAFNVNTTQNISTLSNLTVAGFVQTTSGGLLSSAALTSGQVTTALGFTPGTGTVTSIATNNGITGGTITTTGTIGLAAITANSVLGNITGGSAVPTAVATSSLFLNASATNSGLLTSTDWNTFNNKGSGTVTAVSVASTNGFAGSSSGGATPVLTLSTSITGILKGNGTAISAASAGTDYLTPTGSGAALTGIPTSVSNSDSTLTVSPTTGAVVASLNLGHTNTWSVLQNFATLTATGATTTSLFSGSIEGNSAAFGATATTTITSTGAIGIASTSPGALFSINATGVAPYILVGSSTQGQVFSVQPSSATHLGVGTTSPWTTVGIVGTVAINGLVSSAAGNDTVCVNPTTLELFIGGSATSCAVSNPMFKEDIATSTVGLDELRKIVPITFYFKNASTTSGDPAHQIGFSATQLFSVDPRLTQQNATGTPMALRLDDMMGLAYKSIIDLADHQDVQDQEIAELKIEVAQLQRVNICRL